MMRSRTTSWPVSRAGIEAGRRSPIFRGALATAQPGPLRPRPRIERQAVVASHEPEEVADDVLTRTLDRGNFAGDLLGGKRSRAPALGVEVAARDPLGERGQVGRAVATADESVADYAGVTSPVVAEVVRLRASEVSRLQLRPAG